MSMGLQMGGTGEKKQALCGAGQDLRGGKNSSTRVKRLINLEQLPSFCNLSIRRAFSN